MNDSDSCERGKAVSVGPRLREGERGREREREREREGGGGGRERERWREERENGVIDGHNYKDREKTQ